MWNRKLATAALLFFVCLLLFVAAYMAAGALPVQDFAQYWSAAHLVQQNPYSYELVSRFQNSQGIHVDPPLVLKNPPWTIPFLLPLGLFSYRVAFAFWTLLSLIVLMGCTHALWRALRSTTATPILLTLLFGPAIVQIILGQWTVLVLLGITVFLIAAERRQDWLAGASLVLVLSKPHTALLFLVAVALWTLRYRRWRIVISTAFALLGTALVVELLNPHIWFQFLERTTLVVHETEAYPNLGGMLYLISGVHALGLLPELLGLVWLGFYFRKHRRTWSWWNNGTMVILCSVVFSYYSYPYDEILAIPALLFAFARGNSSRYLFFTPFLITEAGYALYLTNVAGRLGYGYMFLWWTALGWLATFLLGKASFLVPSNLKRMEAE